ncbi:hypothetical protein OHO83_08930 [Streptomyces sp. NBC_00569]|uniref:hypothetical protein n=1 Tax=Streptomyces sp. NBC_00569 TaxID=2975780 RepID=UPI002E81277C|nr:hypothetical protein [Streptomyces sp. NBC_00569]WUB92431.1 hypothetical protein OHO83_08930 [Streptomyces sp. NBC_00569]
MSAAEPVRTARFYTSARRLPWVIGKFADWKIWFGPYNAVQIGVMSIGGLALVRTASYWWSLLGPVPVVLWVVAIFVCRRHKIAGRTPVGAALGVGLRLLQPAGGRIGGRAARGPRPQAFSGAFTLQALTKAEPSAVTERVTVARPQRRTARRPAPRQSASAAVRRPLSPVQAALLAAKEQN